MAEHQQDTGYVKTLVGPEEGLPRTQTAEPNRLFEEFMRWQQQQRRAEPRLRAGILPATRASVTIDNIDDPIGGTLTDFGSSAVTVYGTYNGSHLIATLQYFNYDPNMGVGSAVSMSPTVTTPSSGHWQCIFNLPNNTFALFSILCGNTDGTTDAKTRPFAIGTPE